MCESEGIGGILQQDPGGTPGMGIGSDVMVHEVGRGEEVRTVSRSSYAYAHDCTHCMVYNQTCRA